MAAAPRFSIVIPTRNRCELLRRSLRSALRQTVDDLEVVVSMNDCTDATAEVAASFNDSRVRIATTLRPMLMHESWQFALEQARGEYITFLCDDDALQPRALERASRAMEQADADAAYWPLAYWIEPPEADGAAKASFRFGAAYSDRILEVDREALIEGAFDLRVTLNEFVPRMLNTLIHRSVVESARRAGVALFRPSCPDYSAMLTIASLADRLICIDAPLAVAGLTPASIGASAMHRGENGREFCRSIVREVPDLVRPPILLTIRCWIAQTYMQCAAELPWLRGSRINDVHLFGWARQELDHWHKQGYDVARPIQEYSDALQQQSPSYCSEVEEFIQERRSVETQEFLGQPCNGANVLGSGPFVAPSGIASKHGFASIDVLAEGLERWIADRAVSLRELWDEIALQAGGRQPVIYGMGNVGQSLVRSACIVDSNVTPHVVDDGRKTAPSRCIGITSADLHPLTHFIVVTPEHDQSIRSLLQQRGFAATSDYMHVEQVMSQVRSPASQSNTNHAGELAQTLASADAL